MVFVETRIAFAPEPCPEGLAGKITLRRRRATSQ
jgi:hypothetical protein